MENAILIIYYIQVKYSVRHRTEREVFNMLVSDLFKVLDNTQDVDIYSRKIGVYIFSGESGDITSSCLEFHVNKLFANNDLVVIEVE